MPENPIILLSMLAIYLVACIYLAVLCLQVLLFHKNTLDIKNSLHESEICFTHSVSKGQVWLVKQKLNGYTNVLEEDEHKKCQRVSKFPEVEKALMNYIREARDNNAILTSAVCS